MSVYATRAVRPGIKATLAFVVGGWLTFRLASDWPRGLFAAGTAGVPDWAMSLSYVGLCLWITIAIPATLSFGRVLSRLRSDPILQAQLLFLGYQLVAFITSVRSFGLEGAVAGAYILLVSLSLIVLYLLGLRLGESEQVRSIDRTVQQSARLVAWALLPSIVLALLQLATGTGKDVGDGIPRIYGTTSSPNVLGSVLLVALAPVFAASAGSRRGAWKLLLYLMVGLFVACLSLSGFICLAFAMALYWLRRATTTRKLPLDLNWIVAGLIGASVVAIAAGEVLATRFASLGDEENSLVWRLRTWTDILGALQDPWVFVFGGGLGFDHLGIEYPPHNEYLRLLLETGVVGLCLALLVWYRVYRALGAAARSWHPGLQRYSAALQAGTAGLLLWALADSVMRTAPSVILLWVLIGYAVGCARSRYHLST
jgi:hypothetical protein